MNEDQRYLVLSKRKAISRDLFVGDVFSHLQSTFALKIDEVELIKLERTSREQVEKLIDILLNKKRNYFTHFHNALKYAEYFHLAELLMSGVKEDDDNNYFSDDDEDSDTGDLPDIETILKVGGVPQMPQVYVKRQECIESLQNALQNLDEVDGWVILHGMAGSGKTLLSADALNDESLVYTCFPGGIFWVSIGNIDDAKLLMKMQNLCSWLDVDKIHQLPKNLEESRDRLRILFSQEHPRSLLVLDDVWTDKVEKYFDIRVRTLVTTRNPGISNKISSSNLHMVKIKESFDINQSEQVLSRWTNISVDKLPAEAAAIINRCRGSPLAISMIGALLKGHTNRWSYYLTQLEQQKTSKLKSKLSYSYSSLYDALAVSYDNLSTETKEKFRMLCIFESDVNIPLNVLSMLWNCDEVEVEDMMDELIEHSLAYVIYDGENCQCYSLHDIQLDFLKEMVSRDGDVNKFHKRLVSQYYTSNNGSYVGLQNDGYVYWYLVSHLLQSDNLKDAVELMRNFMWLKSCIKHTSAVSLILTFKEIIKCVEKCDTMKEYLDELNDLGQLISIHTHLLSSSDIDLVQLSLLQPTSDIVLKSARNSVEKQVNINGTKKLYYNWMNQPKKVKENILLSTRIHEGPVNSCRFSQSSKTKNIVSCGDDGLIKVWDCESGEILKTFEGHAGSVNYAEFIDSDRKIVSCSSDNSIKVWSAGTGKELLSLLGHKGDVLCCSCAKDGKLLASASVDGTVKIWNLDTGFLYFTFTDHEDVVNWCCFSSNSKYVASCSNDLYVKIWDIESKELLTNGCGEDFISFCIFTPDDCGVVYTCLNSIKMFSVEEETTKWTIECPCDVLSVCYSPDKKFLASAHVDMAARLYDLENEVFVRVFTGHTSWLTSVSFCESNGNIVTSSADGICTLWDAGESHDLENEKLTQVFDVSFMNSMEPLIVVCTNKNHVKLYKKDKLCVESVKLTSKITSCGIAKDECYTAVGFENGEVKILQVNDLKIVHNFDYHTDAITTTKFGYGRLLCSDELVITVINVADGNLLSKIKGHTESITKCFLFDNGLRIASSSYDGFLKVSESENGSEISALRHDEHITAALMSCTISTDEEMLLTCSADSECKIWSRKDNILLLDVKDDDTDVIRCVSFSNDGKYFASGSDSGSAKVWQVKDGEMVCECEGHNIWIEDIKFDDKNQYLLTISENIRIYSLAGELMQTIPIIGSYLKSIHCSNDLSTCVTVDNLGHLYILERLQCKD